MEIDDKVEKLTYNGHKVYCSYNIEPEEFPLKISMKKELGI